MVNFLKQRPLPCIIDNDAFLSVNQYTSFRKDVPYSSKEPLHKVYCINVEEAKKAVNACSSAFSLWKQSSTHERIRIFTKAKQLLQERLKNTRH